MDFSIICHIFVKNFNMNKTYQPFILQKAEEIFEILKEDVKSSDFAKDLLCSVLTEKFIAGELSSGDSIQGIFNEEELLSFINEVATHDDLEHLIELKLVNYFNDENDEITYFLTEEGKMYVEMLLKEDIKLLE